MNIDHENTVRALAGKELFANNQWFCAVGIHTWLKWKSPVKTRRGVYDYVEQYRECGCCGKAQRKLLSRD